MPSEFMINSKVKYAGAGPSEVPFPNYRCKSSCVKPAKTNDRGVQISVATNHPCKIVIDHPGDHFCICGFTWPSTTNKEKVS